jgi:hypothetical protein
MRVAAPKLFQHLRNLGLERRLAHAIVGALTHTNDSMTARSVSGVSSSGATRTGAISWPRRSRRRSTLGSRPACMCHHDT